MAMTHPAPTKQQLWDRSALDERLPPRVPRETLPEDLSELAFKAREMMLDLGIKPEDNEFSRAIIAEREGL